MEGAGARSLRVAASTWGKPGRTGA